MHWRSFVKKNKVISFLLDEDIKRRIDLTYSLIEYNKYEKNITWDFISRQSRKEIYNCLISDTNTLRERLQSLKELLFVWWTLDFSISSNSVIMVIYLHYSQSILRWNEIIIYLEIVFVSINHILIIKFGSFKRKKWPFIDWKQRTGLTRILIIF